MAASPRLTFILWAVSSMTMLCATAKSIVASENARETSTAKVRPNILWFVVDDMSANFSCYGETTIQTPHVDRLAREGVMFKNAFVTAPVCSPSRSAMITGMYQTSIGAHHHRSGRGTEKIRLADGVALVPSLFQKAGYFTCIGSGLPDVSRVGKKRPGGSGELGKTDYNFEWNPDIYDGPDWTARKSGQPFFMQVQLAGGKLRGGTDASARALTERARLEFETAVRVEDNSNLKTGSIPGGRSTLRTLPIATTLVALVLGLIVWLR